MLRSSVQVTLTLQKQEVSTKDLVRNLFLLEENDFAMYYFYVLYSLKDHKLYKGYSAHIENRFIVHLAGGTSSTKNRRPLVLIHLEAFQSKTEALIREKTAKSLEGGAALTQLLKDKGILNDQRILNLHDRNI